MSHGVVDHIMRLYIKKFGSAQCLVRLGPLSRIATDLLCYVPSSFETASEGLMDILVNASVVFTTLATAVTRYTDLKASVFDVSIVDESSVVIEAMMWSPILVSRRLVIIGDPQQLPPIVHSNTPELSVTLFDRLMSLYPAVFVMLDTQYRMCPELMRWPSEAFYQGMIKTPEAPLTTLQQTPIVCLSSPDKTEFRGGRNRSYANVHEIAQVDTILTTLASEGVDVAADVVVISPYNYQVHLLRQLLVAFPTVEVSSIDAFQVK